MCEFCENSKSLFYDKHSKDVREIVVEKDGSLSVSSNHFDRDEYKKNMTIGFSPDESAKMSQYSYNINIKYCPICGKFLSKDSEPKSYADTIRSMNDEQLALFLICFKNTFGDEYEGEMSCLDWLHSEVVNEMSVEERKELVKCPTTTTTQKQRS